MYRSLALCITLCLASAVTGCKAPSEPQDATTAVGGMMPSGDTTPELQYIADQSEVKVLPERTISTEPLSTFREKLEAKRAEEAAKTATSEPASGKSMSGDDADETKANAKSAETTTAASDDSKTSKKDDDSGWGEDDSGSNNGDKDKDKDNSNDNDSDW